MKAMILAAGLGTRLRPLTDDRPKALVEVAGRTMLELTLARLRSVGIDEVIVNTHHFADKMAACLEAHRNFGMRVEVSREEILLDTGGGLKKAQWFFEEPGSDPKPFVLHNVDVLSTVELTRMVAAHVASNALVTLAVQSRSTSRYLLFDESGLLCGRRAGQTGDLELARPCPAPQALAFAGIHILSPAIFGKITESGVFSIIDLYLRLAAEGERVLAFRADEFYWRDLGRPEQVARAAEDILSGVYPGPIE